MAIKAKFYVSNVAVSQIDENAQPKSGTVHLQAVGRGAVNKRWAAWTPAGRVEMTINGGALAHFMTRVGKELAVTFEDANLDPATHAFDALEDEYQPEGSYRETTCAECGQSQEAHS